MSLRLRSNIQYAKMATLRKAENYRFVPVDLKENEEVVSCIFYEKIPKHRIQDSIPKKVLKISILLKN